MRPSSKCSRRQFVYAGTSGMAATIVATSSPARTGELEAHVQAPPPAATAPRILRKPPTECGDRPCQTLCLLTRDEARHIAIIASTWAVFVYHAHQRQCALGFVGADDMLRRDSQQSFGDVWIAKSHQFKNGDPLPPSY